MAMKIIQSYKTYSLIPILSCQNWKHDMMIQWVAFLKDRNAVILVYNQLCDTHGSRHKLQVLSCVMMVCHLQKNFVMCDGISKVHYAGKKFVYYLDTIMVKWLRANEDLLCLSRLPIPFFADIGYKASKISHQCLPEQNWNVCENSYSTSSR